MLKPEREYRRDEGPVEGEGASGGGLPGLCAGPVERRCSPLQAHVGRSGPHSSRGGAPTDLREAFVGPLQRVQVGGVVQVKRRTGEPDNPPARRGPP